MFFSRPTGSGSGDALSFISSRYGGQGHPDRRASNRMVPAEVSGTACRPTVHSFRKCEGKGACGLPRSRVLGRMHAFRTMRRFLGLCLLVAAALMPLAPAGYAVAKPASSTMIGMDMMAGLPDCLSDTNLPADCADICPLQALCAAQRLAGFVRDNEPLPQRLASSLSYRSSPSIWVGKRTIPPDIPPPRS